jgi:hypothetical protein
LTRTQKRNARSRKAKAKVVVEKSQTIEEMDIAGDETPKSVLPLRVLASQPYRPPGAFNAAWDDEKKGIFTKLV